MEYTNWWNSLSEERKKEINKLHFTCEYGKESDFDICRTYANLVINKEQEHLFWWNSLNIEKRDKLSQTYFNIETSDDLLNDSILHIFNKVKENVTLVNVNQRNEVKITKLKDLTEEEKRNRDRKDMLTTMLGLCQLLIYLFDKLSMDKSIFRHELKKTGKLFLTELEKTMNVYFLLNGEEQFNQADLVNEVVFWVEHGIKLAFRAGEMTEETCKSLISDYRKFTDMYNIENKFLETLELEILNENN